MIAEVATRGSPGADHRTSPDQMGALDERLADRMAAPLAELQAARAALPADIDRLLVREVLTQMTPPGAPDARFGLFLYTNF